jgi:hypothetical protein
MAKVGFVSKIWCPNMKGAQMQHYSKTVNMPMSSYCTGRALSHCGHLRTDTVKSAKWNITIRCQYCIS